MWVEMWSLDAWKPSLYCMARAFQTIPSGCQPPIASPGRRATRGAPRCSYDLRCPWKISTNGSYLGFMSRQSVPIPVAEVCDAQMPSCSFR